MAVGVSAAAASLGCSAEDGAWEQEPVGVAELANNCGAANYQDVERYDGTFGVPKALVAERQAPVGEGHTARGTCSGTLIASDIFLSAGHCEYAVGDTVVFNNQLDPNGLPRTRDTRSITEIFAQKNDVNNADPARRFDYAVVRVANAPATTYGYAKLADEEARTGAVFNQTLTAMGHPGLVAGSFNRKKVSTGPFADASAALIPNWFGAQIDLVEGSSGCGITRADGQLIGVHTTAGCGGTTGNNNMRIPVLLDDAPILLQVAAMQGVQFANINAAGGADAVIVNFSGVQARISNGAQFGSSSNWTTSAYFGALGTFLADVTGDGRADAIVVNSNAITVRRSNGSSFNANERWLSIPFFGSLGTYFADVTGDGKADAIALDPGAIVVSPANTAGTAFLAPQNWSNAFFGSLATTFADVTGDRKADAIVVNDNLISVRRSTGTAFGATENWTSNRFFGAFGTFVADVTGDGKADLIGVNNGVTTVRRSNGSSFAANENWLTVSHFGSMGTAFVDVTGDGKADSVAVTPTGITVRPANSAGTAFGSLSTWVSSGYFGAM